MSLKYNAFAGKTWDVDNLEWFNGFVITKSLKVIEVRMAYPIDPEVKEKCVLVLYDDISSRQKENFGKFVLFGSSLWDTTKKGIQAKLRALKETSVSAKEPKE